MAFPHIRIILVRPQHPGNIGATARAMKNMGLSQLTLVAPRTFPAEEAIARAAGADDILASARVVASVREAVAECPLVVATSARPRTIAWPCLTPKEAASALWAGAQTAPVALLFGAERTGLTNDEIDFAQALVQIPVDPVFPSLNLAAAVQILCYEIRLSAEAGRPPGGEGLTAHKPAPQEALNQLIDHLERVLIHIGFLDLSNPRKLMRRLIRLFRRAAPDTNEILILRGILSAIERPYPPKE